MSIENAIRHWHIILVAVFVAGLAIDFVVRFGANSYRLRRTLDRSIKALTVLRARSKGSELVDLSIVETKAMPGRALPHLWREYSKTLHRQQREDENGQLRTERWRSTALAENFFTEQALVDSELRTEYFKHLPGLLTGLGIIGTFMGLIRGLSNFAVSSDPTKAQENLSVLVATVGEAFYVSAVAIGLAMLFTWIEKTAVTARCRQVEEIRELVDGMFTGGAGEEYLEKLVASSENAATQSAQIKDALVADLKEILTTLAGQQMAAQRLSVGQLSTDVGKAISDGLAKPMETIAEAVRGVSSDQGDAVNKMLTDVLAAFAAQMRDMFGGQMQGLGELMQKASEAMQSTAEQFRQLAANMGQAGTSAVDAMGERLGKALEAMDARQGAMNAQMGAFVEQIRALVADSQTESSQKLKDSLSAMGDQVAGVVEQLKRQAEAAAEAQGQRESRFENSTQAAVGSLSEQVERLLAQSAETNRSLQGSVSSLAQATDKAITGLNSGAETLLVAAGDFARAGDGVSGTMKEAAVAGEAIKAASSQLTMSTEGAKAIFADYAKTRDAFTTMVAELKLTVDNAKRDASMTSEIVGRIEAAARQLAVAQQQSEDYLQGVNDVITKAHQSFREQLEKTLREGNRQFQTELSQSVQLLSGAIKNLDDVFDSIPRGR